MYLFNDLEVLFVVLLRFLSVFAYIVTLCKWYLCYCKYILLCLLLCSILSFVVTICYYLLCFSYDFRV